LLVWSDLLSNPQSEGDSLFDSVERSRKEPATHEETNFQFLNRIAGPFWERVRGLADLWYQRIPPSQGGDLRNRFRSKNSASTLAAFWEIYIHEALLRHGFDVTVHPKIPSSERSPDFLAESDSASFYVEATSYFDQERTSGEERRRDRLYDAVNKLWNPNFHVWIDIESEGESSPPGAPLRDALDRWLADLDPDAVNASHEPGNMFDLPNFTWERDGWTISFWAIPIKPEAKGQADSRLLGVYGTGEAKFIDDKPFMVALSCHTLFVDHISIVDALYGDEAVQFGHNADGEVVTRGIRHPNGFWRGPDGPRNRRVSAVLLGRNVTPWSVTDRAPELWHHPFANHPLDVELIFPTQQLNVNQGRLVKSDAGMSMHEFFGLPPEWPGPDEAFPDD
jgi:hypothetical protein